jgi:hypothetical protein
VKTTCLTQTQTQSAQGRSNGTGLAWYLRGTPIGGESGGQKGELDHDYFICYVVGVTTVTEHSRKCQDPKLWTPVSVPVICQSGALLTDADAVSYGPCAVRVAFPKRHFRSSRTATGLDKERSESRENGKDALMELLFLFLVWSVSGRPLILTLRAVHSSSGWLQLGDTKLHLAHILLTARCPHKPS